MAAELIRKLSQAGSSGGILVKRKPRIVWEEAGAIVDPQIDADGVHRWPFDPGLPVAVRFQVLRERLGPRLNRHDYLEVLVIQSGEAMCQVRDRRFPVRTGELFCIGNHHHHRLWGNGARPAKLAVLYFLPRAIGKADEPGESVQLLVPFFSQPDDFRHVVARSTGIPGEVLRLLLRIHSELPAADSRARLSVRSCLRMLLALLMNHYAACPGAAGGLVRGSADLDRLRPLFDLIDRGYQQQISIEDAAGALHMSGSHFMRFFRRVCGQPFGAYLKEFRVAKAQALLGGGQMPLAEVAQATGFCDQSYFGLVFREVTGMTPGEYRRRAIRLARRAGGSAPGGAARLRPSGRG